MKYLTREWYVKARLSYIDGMVRCSKLAEKYDESFYKKVIKLPQSSLIVSKTIQIFPF